MKTRVIALIYDRAVVRPKGYEHWSGKNTHTLYYHLNQESEKSNVLSFYHCDEWGGSCANLPRSLLFKDQDQLQEFDNCLRARNPEGALKILKVLPQPQPKNPLDDYSDLVKFFENYISDQTYNKKITFNTKSYDYLHPYQPLTEKDPEWADFAPVKKMAQPSNPTQESKSLGKVSPVSMFAVVDKPVEKKQELKAAP